MEISKEQWDAWRADPVTVALMDWARASVHDMHEKWENGGLVNEDHFQSAMNDSAAIGACRVLRTIEALEYENMIGSQEDGRKPESIGPKRGY